jgi:hypothetical protein
MNVALEGDELGGLRLRGGEHWTDGTSRLLEGPAGVQRPLEVLGLREQLLFLDPSELSDGRWRRHPRA